MRAIYFHHQPALKVQGEKIPFASIALISSHYVDVFMESCVQATKHNKTIWATPCLPKWYFVALYEASARKEPSSSHPVPFCTCSQWDRIIIQIPVLSLFIWMGQCNAMSLIKMWFWRNAGHLQLWTQLAAFVRFYWLCLLCYYKYLIIWL